MPRWIARLVFVLLGSAVAAVLGTATALFTSRSGKDLLARLLSDQSRRLVRGSLAIGRIRGDFLTNLTLDSVVIRDTTGDLLASVPRVHLRFGLGAILGSRYVFDSVHASRPEIQIVKHRGGRMNFQEVLKLGERPRGTGPGDLIEIRNLVIDSGTATIRAPWNPDGRLRTDRQRDSALAAERAKPGRRIEPAALEQDGLQLIRVVSDLSARFDVLTVSTPDRKPLRGVVDSMAARLNDPGVTITDLVGEFTQGADSLAFTFSRAALPNTLGRARGRVDWPRDTVLFGFELASDAVDLVDLRWISPNFPRLTGRGRVVANSLAGSRTEYTITGLDLQDPNSRVRGRLVAILDVYRGLGFRNLDLDLDNLDLEAVRPYLDTLPVAGWISGPLRADGFFDRMTVDFDWVFRDARLPETPESQIALSGPVVFGGPLGLSFERARIDHSDLDLRTIRLVTPAVRLDGRLSLAGTLDGPWRNVTFDGRAEHQDGGRPRSAITGVTRLDTRGAILALEADLRVDTLSFEGIRGSFPDLTPIGSLSGPLELEGDLARLHVDGDLRGEIGQYAVRGRLTLQPPVWAAESLAVDFREVNLAALRPGTVTTRLQGRLAADARVDSLAVPEGRVDLALGAGLVREVAFDSARVRAAIEGSLMTVDTARVHWEGGGVGAAGTFGWRAPHDGTIRGTATVLSLTPFDSLVHVLTGVSPTGLPEEEELRGRVRGEFILAGSLDQWRLEARARMDSTDWLTYNVRRAAGTLELTGGRAAELRFAVGAEVDTLRRRNLALTDVAATAAGTTRDFSWTLRGAEATRADVRAGGRWREEAGARIVNLDSLAVTVLERRWTLARPTEIVARDSNLTTDTLVLATGDGSGAIRVEGDLPWRTPGRLSVVALGIGLRDLYALAQRDTAGIAGVVAVDVRLGGTLRAPTFRGSATVTGPVIAERRAPMVRSVFNYEDRLLQTNLTFWRTGRPVLDVDARLPLDLALANVPRRQLPGPLTIRARADSVDLAVMEALTPNIRRVQGSFGMDAQVGGSWDEPRLDGFVSVTDGSLRVPGLGVAYGPINGRVVLSGDSLIADSLSIRGGIGDLVVLGSVRLERLTHPVLDLALSAREFPVIDVPDYLTLQVRGDVKLTGPIERPVLTGEALATNSVVYFADLISKDIVNLEDPLTADLVDTTALRAQQLGSRFQSRFLDSLAIRDLRFRVGQDVWLRSNEANIQLEGQVTVNKERRSVRGNQYRVSGQFTTPRGSYTLKLGPVFRTFTVDQGTVQYFNTQDLNAALDIQAHHLVRTVLSGGDEYPVIARITGTLLVPKLSLSSAPDRPPLSERDLISLLVTGTTTSALLSADRPGLSPGVAAAIATTVLSSELQRTLISDVGAPFDLVEIRPGVAQGTGLFATGGTVTTLSVGRQLSRRLFVTLNLGGCLRTFDFGARYLGATLEYRLHQSLRLQVAAEPVQSCLTQVANALALQNRYQFAADLKWDREY